MNADIVCVGKLKEPWQRDACAEYMKRLSRYGRYALREVPDFPEPEKSSDALRAQVMEKEGAEILRLIKPSDHVIALCIDAKEPGSESLAASLSALSQSGRRIVFMIGGSLGISKEALSRADDRLSLSRLTFPHALARVVLLEQLYRCEKILAGERYHK